MRNLHAYDYENVDFEIVWNTLNEEIPAIIYVAADEADIKRGEIKNMRSIKKALTRKN